MLVTMMLLGSVALWVGVPFGWLWIGSLVEPATGSIGLALFTMLIGMGASIAVLVGAFGWLNRKHVERLELRGRDPGPITALEQALVGSAALAVLGYAVWFFGFSGSPPLPGLELSY